MSQKFEIEIVSNSQASTNGGGGSRGGISDEERQLRLEKRRADATAARFRSEKNRLQQLRQLEMNQDRERMKQEREQRRQARMVEKEQRRLHQQGKKRVAEGQKAINQNVREHARADQIKARGERELSKLKKQLIKEERQAALQKIEDEQRLLRVQRENRQVQRDFINDFFGAVGHSRFGYRINRLLDFINAVKGLGNQQTVGTWKDALLGRGQRKTTDLEEQRKQVIETSTEKAEKRFQSIIDSVLRGEDVSNDPFGEKIKEAYEKVVTGSTTSEKAKETLETLKEQMVEWIDNVIPDPKEDTSSSDAPTELFKKRIGSWLDNVVKNFTVSQQVPVPPQPSASTPTPMPKPPTPSSRSQQQNQPTPPPIPNRTSTPPPLPTTPPDSSGVSTGPVMDVVMAELVNGGGGGGIGSFIGTAMGGMGSIGPAAVVVGAFAAAAVAGIGLAAALVSAEKVVDDFANSITSATPELNVQKSLNRVQEFLGKMRQGRMFGERLRKREQLIGERQLRYQSIQNRYMGTLTDISIETNKLINKILGLVDGILTALGPFIELVGNQLVGVLKVLGVIAENAEYAIPIYGSIKFIKDTIDQIYGKKKMQDAVKALNARGLGSELATFFNMPQANPKINPGAPNNLKFSF